MPILIGMALGAVIQGTAFVICVLLERREQRKKLEAERAQNAPEPPETPTAITTKTERPPKKYPCGNCGRMFAPHTCLKCD